MVQLTWRATDILSLRQGGTFVKRLRDRRFFKRAQFIDFITAFLERSSEKPRVTVGGESGTKKREAQRPSASVRSQLHRTRSYSGTASKGH